MTLGGKIDYFNDSLTVTKNEIKTINNVSFELTYFFNRSSDVYFLPLILIWASFLDMLLLVLIIIFACAICISLLHPTTMEGTYSYSSMIRGHHVYKEAWAPFIGEELTTELLKKIACISAFILQIDLQGIDPFRPGLIQRTCLHCVYTQ